MQAYSIQSQDREEGRHVDRTFFSSKALLRGWFAFNDVGHHNVSVHREGRNLGKTKELNLEGCSATGVEGVTDEYTWSQKLNMSKVGPATLEGIPALPALAHLENLYYLEMYGFHLVSVDKY